MCLSALPFLYAYNILKTAVSHYSESLPDFVDTFQFGLKW